MIALKLPVGRGLIVKTGILILIVGLYFIGSHKNIINPTFHINGVFYKTDGLQVGAPISFKGVYIGVIGNIEIISDSTIRVDMVIKENVRKFIKKNALASIGSEGLLGNRMVKISSDNQKDEMITENSEIGTFQELKIENVVAEFKATVRNTTRIMDNVLLISKSINESELFKDSFFTNNLSEAVCNLNKINRGFKDSIFIIHPIMDNLMSISANTLLLSNNVNQISDQYNSGNSSYETMINFWNNTVSTEENIPIVTVEEQNYPGLEYNEQMKNNIYFWRKYFKIKEVKNDTLKYKK